MSAGDEHRQRGEVLSCWTSCQASAGGERERTTESGSQMEIKMQENSVQVRRETNGMSKVQTSNQAFNKYLILEDNYARLLTNYNWKINVISKESTTQIVFMAVLESRMCPWLLLLLSVLCGIFGPVLGDRRQGWQKARFPAVPIGIFFFPAHLRSPHHLTWVSCFCISYFPDSQSSSSNSGCFHHVFQIGWTNMYKADVS